MSVVSMRFEFTTGRYQVVPWVDGPPEPAEWPPSPWRIAAALAQVWRRVRPDAPAAQVAAIFGALGGTPIFALPPASLGYAGSQPVASTPGLAGVQGFVSISRRGRIPGDGQGPTVEVVWPRATLCEGERDLLSDLLQHLPFLGGPESWCRARLVEDMATLCNTLPAGAAGASGELAQVLCLSPGAALRQLLTEADAAPGGRHPQGGRFVRYLRPRLLVPAAQPRGPARAVCFRLRGTRLPAVSDALLVGDLARRGAMAQYGRRFAGALSPALSGRQEGQARADQHRHAHYLTTDEDGDGYLDHLTVWAPGGLTGQDVQALGELRDLRPPGGWVWDVPPLRLDLVGDGDESILPSRMRGPSRLWRSCTPFVLTRHAKVRSGAEAKDSPESQLRRELAFRDLADSLVAADTDDPGRNGTSAWARFVVARPGHPMPVGPAHGFRITFREPRQGPIVAGSGAHFGLGLFEAEGDGLG